MGPSTKRIILESVKSLFKPFPWILCVGLGVLFFKAGPTYWAEHWLSKWQFLMFCFSIGVSVWFGRKTHWIFAPITAYSLLSALWISINVLNPYLKQFNVIGILSIDQNAIYAHLIVLASALFLGVSTEKNLRGSHLLLALFCLISAGVTLFCETHTENGLKDGFFSGNASMNGCLIAGLTPFVWYFLPEWAQLIVSGIMTIAILQTERNIPIGILGVSIATYALSRFPQKKLVLGLSIPLAAVFLVGAHYLLGEHFGVNSGRFREWVLAWHWMLDQKELVSGFGLGSAAVILPLVQAANNEMHAGEQIGVFIWLHNEWLQIVFELGFVGLALVLPPWVYLLKKSYRAPHLFAAFCAFSVMALMNYPLRLPIHCFSWLLICALILREDTDGSY